MTETSLTALTQLKSVLQEPLTYPLHNGVSKTLMREEVQDNPPRVYHSRHLECLVTSASPFAGVTKAW